ncbi:MAG: hypothetical protein H6Q36_1955, partial [Chloroflexi bacterium]|nr:hypothetical protein [Chloroflexota bacterium]
EAMAAGTIPLERCGERLARLVELGMSLAARRPGTDRGKVVNHGAFNDPPTESGEHR